MAEIIIKISDKTKVGDFAISVHGEHTLPSRVKRVFDVIMPSLREHYTPVRTHFRTRTPRAIKGGQS